MLSVFYSIVPFSPVLLAFGIMVYSLRHPVHICDWGPWIRRGAQDKTSGKEYAKGLEVKAFRVCKCGAEQHILGKWEG